MIEDLIKKISIIEIEQAKLKKDILELQFLILRLLHKKRKEI